MIFTEEHKRYSFWKNPVKFFNGKFYEYKTEDVFGELCLESKNKVTGEQLDDIVKAILKIKTNAKIIEGEIKELNLKYKLIKENKWLEQSKKSTN